MVRAAAAQFIEATLIVTGNKIFSLKKTSWPRSHSCHLNLLHCIALHASHNAVLQCIARIACNEVQCNALHATRATKCNAMHCTHCMQRSAMQCIACNACNEVQCNALHATHATKCNAMHCMQRMQRSAMQCIACNACNEVQCNALHATHATKCNAMQCNAMQCNAMQRCNDFASENRISFIDWTFGSLRFHSRNCRKMAFSSILLRILMNGIRSAGDKGIPNEVEVAAATC